MQTKEKIVNIGSGWGMLIFNLLIYAGAITAFITAVRLGNGWIGVPSVLCFLLAVFTSIGFFTLEPNKNAVLILFGEYKGTVSQQGLCWANPFLRKVKISMRMRNFNTEKLKVNDRDGNPVEIGAVVVWTVREAAHAVFDVDDFVEYVHTQSESAVRHMATKYPYDTPSDDDHRVSLRGSTDQIAEALSEELQERMQKAGIKVEEARLSHLAYAPEIASAMLQRQQAQAIVDARATIVEGAVSMVEMALDQLKKRGIVHLDDDKQATMVSNLLVVLCGDKSTQPVLNTGGLY